MSQDDLVHKQLVLACKSDAVRCAMKEKRFAEVQVMLRFQVYDLVRPMAHYNLRTMILGACYQIGGVNWVANIVLGSTTGKVDRLLPVIRQTMHWATLTDKDVILLQKLNRWDHSTFIERVSMSLPPLLPHDDALDEIFLYGRLWHLKDAGIRRAKWREFCKVLGGKEGKDRMLRVYHQSADRARKAALAFMATRMPSRDTSFFIAKRVWDSRFHPAVWGVNLREDENIETYSCQVCRPKYDSIKAMLEATDPEDAMYELW